MGYISDPKRVHSPADFVDWTYCDHPLDSVVNHVGHRLEG